MPDFGIPDLDEFFGLLDRHARESSAGRTLQRPVAARFDIGAAGCWVLRVFPTGPGECIKDDPAAPTLTADCSLSVSDDIILDLLNGRRKFAVTLMKGQISVRGDRSIFTNDLQPLFRAAMSDFKARRAARRASDVPAGLLRVVVHGASIVAYDDRPDSFAVYLIEVFEGESRWTLTRRWSEVRALDRRLRRIRPAVASLPALPRSLDFAGSLDRTFLSERGKIIAKYVNEALRAVPTSILMCSGASLALRLFLSPGENAAAAPTPRRSSAGRDSLASPPSMGRRDTSLNEVSFAAMGRSTDRPSGFESAREDGTAINAPARAPLLSPGWTALAAPVRLSPLQTTPQTVRTPDVYSAFAREDTADDDGNDDDGDRATGQEPGAPLGSWANAGVLVDSLRAAASTRPILAEADYATLQARRDMLQRLRTLEAAPQPVSLLVRGGNAVVLLAGIAWRVGVPMALGLAAAHNGWAVVSLFCLLRAASWAPRDQWFETWRGRTRLAARAS